MLSSAVLGILNYSCVYLDSSIDKDLTVLKYPSFLVLLRLCRPLLKYIFHIEAESLKM